jgi:hypothetical protein
VTGNHPAHAGGVAPERQRIRDQQIQPHCGTAGRRVHNAQLGVGLGAFSGGHKGEREA